MIRKLVFFALLTFLASASGLHAQQSGEAKKPEPSPASRPALPDAAAQAKSDKIIHDIYKAQFADTSHGGKVKLARALLSEAHKTKDDPTGRFVLLKDAKDIAVAAGEIPLALQAIDELEKGYAIDGNDYRVMAVAPMLPRLGGAEALPAAAKATDLLDRLLAEGDSVNAAKLYPAVQAAVGRGTDAVLKARVRNDQLLLAEAEQMRGAAARLKAAPDDPAANLTVGRYECLTRGDWSKGLPMLAKGSDPKLKALAATELAKPTTIQQQFDLAGGWYDWAAQQTGAPQSAGRAHAGAWYRQCEPQLSGLAKTVATKRLAELPIAKATVATSPGKSHPPTGETAPKTPAAAGVTTIDTSGWTELLDKADPATATGIGQWQRDGKVLQYKNPDEHGAGTLVIPCTVDGSYELQLRLTRHFPNGGAPELVIPVGPTSAHVGMGGGVNKFIFLQTIDGKKAKESPALYQGNKVLTPNQEAVFDIRVSLHDADVEINIKLDGKQIIAWQGAQSSISASGDKPHQVNFLIKGWKDVTFSSLKVHVLSGQLRDGLLNRANVADDGDDEKPAAAKGAAPAEAGPPSGASAKPAETMTKPAGAPAKAANAPVKPGGGQAVKSADVVVWTDLLKSLDPAHPAAGKWTREGAGLSSGAEKSNTIFLPYATDGSYEARFKLIRGTEGSDPANLILPAGPGTFALNIAAQSVTLGNVGGQSIPSAPVAAPATLIPAGRECTIDVKVTLQKRNAEIAVSVDGKQVNGWLGPASSLTSPLGQQTDPQAFGLNAGKTKFTLTSVQVHPLSGQLRATKGSGGPNKLFPEIAPDAPKK